MSIDYEVNIGYGFVVDDAVLTKWFAQSNPEKNTDDWGTDEMLEAFLDNFPLLTYECAGNAWVGSSQRAIVIRDTRQTMGFDGFVFPGHVTWFSDAGYEQLVSALDELNGKDNYVEYGWLVGGYCF